MGMYAALLRGVNVGGHNRLSGECLRGVAEAVGLERVRTYLQSGNVVFAAAGAAPETLAQALEARVGEALGLRVRVFVRTAHDVASIVAANPFLEAAGDGRQLHVTFLAREPAPERLAELPTGWGADVLRAHGREVYLFCPGGYGETRFNGRSLERVLGVETTTRNWNTVRALEAMLAV